MKRRVSPGLADRGHNKKYVARMENEMSTGDTDAVVGDIIEADPVVALLGAAEIRDEK